MEVYGKVWGTTMPIFRSTTVEVHRITGRAGRQCSQHHHVAKFNLFFVESGRLLVRTWKAYGLVDETVLGPGQSCTVPPGEVHQFEVLEDVVAYEIYWAAIDPGDIVRQSPGGIIPRAAA